jgi:hypothetical protein
MTDCERINVYDKSIVSLQLIEMIATFKFYVLAAFRNSD